MTTNKDPEKFFSAYGIAGNEVLADAKTIYAEVKRPKGASVHILTGPIYVEGAEPGDALEVRVRDIKFRVPYGVNNTGPGKGVLPKLLKEPTAKLIRIDLERRVALFSDEIKFLSILLWASWRCRRQRVSVWCHRLRREPGAAISISSIAASVRRCFYRCSTGAGSFSPATATRFKVTAKSTAAPSRFRSCRRCSSSCTRASAIKSPRVETATDYLTTGLSVDLNEATRLALQEAVDFLQTEKRMSAADAYALASLAVDLGIGEAVDIVNLVYAKIPKRIFKRNPDFWYNVEGD